MTTKKKLLTVVSVVLILGLAAMGILAYLTDRDSAAAVKAAWSKPATVKFTGSTKSYYDRVNLVWGKSSGASGYQIFRSTNSSSGYECIKTIVGNGTLKWTDSCLDGKQKYHYKVRPYKALNDSCVYVSYSKEYAKQLLQRT